MDSMVMARPRICSSRTYIAWKCGDEQDKSALDFITQSMPEIQNRHQDAINGSA